jgi:hypothetical protein
MAKRKNQSSTNGTAEAVEHESPIREPGDVSQYEHEHYEQIRETTTRVCELQAQSESAKRAAKIAKDAYDDAAADLLTLINGGPDVPQKQYAKRVRLLKEVSADTELGKGFVTLSVGEEFDVYDIEGESVAILVQEVTNFLNAGEYAVIEWSTKPPAPQDGWREVPITRLHDFDVADGLIEKLSEADINTIGELVDFQVDGTELTSIDGIGPEYEAAIADGMVKFWAANPQWAESAAKEPAVA